MQEKTMSIVKINMLNMLRYSKLEYKKFRETNNIIYLQQAGEKLFNVVENYISVINNVKIESFYDAKSLAIKEPPLKLLLYDSRSLHRFFYNGLNEYDIDYAIKLYNSVLQRIETRIKRI